MASLASKNVKTVVRMESSGKVFANQRIVESRSPLMAHYAYGGQWCTFAAIKSPL